MSYITVLVWHSSQAYFSNGLKVCLNTLRYANNDFHDFVRNVHCSVKTRAVKRKPQTTGDTSGDLYLYLPPSPFSVLVVPIHCSPTQRLWERAQLNFDCCRGLKKINALRNKFTTQRLKSCVWRETRLNGIMFPSRFAILRRTNIEIFRCSIITRKQ